MVGLEANQTAVLAKRFQVAYSEENKPFVVVGADVQPCKQQ